MTMQALYDLAAGLLASEMNSITMENAAHEGLVGMRFYDAPIFGVANGADPLFLSLRDDSVVGPGALLPPDVMPSAKSVISWFLPFTKAVRDSNLSGATPSDPWRQARIEGQDMNFALGDALCTALTQDGHEAVQVSRSAFFNMLSPLRSNWSERHVAFIAGLGTFGLSKGLITQKGMAGRFGSVVTSAALAVTERSSQTPFDDCTMCGRCAASCPANAIDPRKGILYGKDHHRCQSYVTGTEALGPCGSGSRLRYGCGKCQVGVPCESCNPRTHT